VTAELDDKICMQPLMGVKDRYGSQSKLCRRIWLCHLAQGQSSSLS